MGKKNFKVVIDPAMIVPPKNLDGSLGPKCNNCGGFGYTMGLKGKTIQCAYCDATGVKTPTNRELQDQVSEIKDDLKKLRKALIENAKMNGIKIKTKI